MNLAPSPYQHDSAAPLSRLHHLCTCGECRVAGDRLYQCPGCGRVVPWCLGAGDDFLELCDDCAVRAYAERDKL